MRVNTHLTGLGSKAKQLIQPPGWRAYFWFITKIRFIIQSQTISQHLYFVLFKYQLKTFERLHASWHKNADFCRGLPEYQSCRIPDRLLSSRQYLHSFPGLVSSFLGSSGLEKGLRVALTTLIYVGCSAILVSSSVALS